MYDVVLVVVRWRWCGDNWHSPGNLIVTPAMK